MTRGSRIVAIDGGADAVAPAEGLAATSEAPLELEEEWDEPAPAPPRPWGLILSATLAIVAVIGWTALFFLTNQAAMLTGGSLAQWTGWIRDWSVPVLLIGMVWLVAMRHSRREAQRFGDTARLLSDESARLETRLTTINRELSLAREFITAQARDLETLGRLASERLSENADRLAGLIRDNGMRLDAIGDVSSAALDNMEKLRGQLPVIASSAKDVTNNIATAGRTAHAQIEDMVTGFNKLNQFGQASERQVQTLRDLVSETLGEFTAQADQFSEITAQRFAALNEQGEQFRAKLDSDEVEALAAIRTRAATMGEELDSARAVLDTHEAESLTSLRARLTAVRDESAAMARAVRTGEESALEAWREAIGRLEEQLRDAIARIGEIDEKALQSARTRLTELAREAEDVDTRMVERDQTFAAEIERRRELIAAQHSEFGERLTAQMAALDAALAERRATHEDHAAAMAAQGEALTRQLGLFGKAMSEAVEQGRDVEDRTSSNLARLSEKLAMTRGALAGTDGAIAQLTDNAVRLLELIQGSVQHSSVDLPKAMAAGETKLAEIEARTVALQEQIQSAEGAGAALSGHLDDSRAHLGEALSQIESLHGAISQHLSRHDADLERIRTALGTTRDDSEALAAKAQAELSTAIEALNQAARGAVSEIETMSAASVAALAARLGEESGEAIDKAVRSRAAEAAGQLEQAAAHAAGVSREAAVQLRDQLAKVNELAGHLERRVAHARARAEEQVDNDFARRVALITESLNSNGIDIARAMDTELSDSAWAAYLRGDRGVFTRRAVKLLDAPEAKSVTQLYENDNDFREHVSRYIHDFEAMLRQLLSTRDGHALGVTLLSSDMGKLYVALAQAIERLRN